MCRAGGRRCPSHSNPLKVAEYNAVRRQRYAMRLNLSANQVFLDIAKVRPVRSNEAKNHFIKDADIFRNKIWPDFSEEAWEEMEQKDYDINTEHGAIALYTSLEYINIRNYLNNPEGFKEYHTKEEVERCDLIVSKIDSAIDQNTEPVKPRTLYRGMHLSKFKINESSFKEYLENHFPVGGVISQNNYMSTSENFQTASSFSGATSLFPNEHEMSFMFEIISKQGAPLGQGISMLNYDEAEVLMPRKAKFKIAAVYENTNFQTEELIDGNESKKLAPVTVIQLVDVDDEGDN